MQVNDLIFKLKHGYQYSANDSSGNPVHRLEPPNKYMLRAATVLEKVISDNNTLIQQVLKLQQDLANAETQIQHLSGLSQHGSASGPGTSTSGASSGQDDAGVNSPATT